MEITSITIIRGITALLFFGAFVMSTALHRKNKKKTDIWMLLSAALFVASAESLVNALEWSHLLPDVMDTTGEYLAIIFSLIWIYIAYRFMSTDAPRALEK